MGTILPQLLAENLYGCMAPLAPYFLAAQVLQTQAPAQAAALEDRIDQILQREADDFTNPDDRTRFLDCHPLVQMRRRMTL